MRPSARGDRRMALEWMWLGTQAADALDGTRIEVAGWMAAAELADAHDYFLLTPDPMCCIGCLPSDADSTIEVFARAPIASRGRKLRLQGRFHRLVDDPTGWRYQLRDAEPIDDDIESGTAPALSRRRVMAASASLMLAACAAKPSTGADQPSEAAARQALATVVTVDLHSHAGRINRPNNSLADVAGPM